MTTNVYNLQTARDQRDAQSGPSAEGLLILIEAEAVASVATAREYRDGEVTRAEAMARLLASTREQIELFYGLEEHRTTPAQRERIVAAAGKLWLAEQIMNAPWPLHLENAR